MCHLIPITSNTILLLTNDRIAENNSICTSILAAACTSTIYVLTTITVIVLYFYWYSS